MTRRIAAALAFVLITAAAFASRASTLRPSSGPYELQVLVNGQPVRRFASGGETWLLGELGERYTLRVLNRSGRRVEAVVSVDGRDVVDGQPGDAQKRGYLVPAYGSVDIDGWRISQAQAAAFRFSSVNNSYAARAGSGREVGVIGVAVFEERVPPPPPVARRPVELAPRAAGESCCSTGAAPQGLNAMGEGGAMPSAAEPQSVPAQPPPSAPRGLRSVGNLAENDSSASRAAAGPSSERAKKSAPANRLGLGTEYGEAVDSRIVEVSFERASSRPSTVLGCRYNDRAGLIAMGIDVDGLSEQAARRTAEPFPGGDRGFAPPPPGWRP